MKHFDPNTPAGTAFAVVTHPTEFADQPEVRAIAWSVLLAERGQRMDLVRFGVMPAPAVPRPRVCSLDTIRRIHAHARSKGHGVRPDDDSAA